MEVSYPSSDSVELFKKHLEGISFLTPETWERFATILQYEKARKKEMLLNNRQMENHMRYIVSGVVKVIYHADDNSFVYDFRGANHFLCDTVSFFARKPTFFSMEALTDCVWIDVPYTKMNQLLQEDLNGQLIVARALNLHLEKRHEKENFLRSNSATERYEILCEMFPDILQIASLGDIASYLGITQQSLSRIRKSK